MIIEVAPPALFRHQQAQKLDSTFGDRLGVDGLKVDFDRLPLQQANYLFWCALPAHLCLLVEGQISRTLSNQLDVQ